MSVHNNLQAFWAGEKPDTIPFTIYQWLWRDWPDDPAWQQLYDKGLAVTSHICPYSQETSSTDVTFRQVELSSGNGHKKIWETPVGTIHQTSRSGWHDEYYLKSAEDYKVMTYVVRNTSVVPQYDAVEEQIEEIKPHEVPLILIGRTPLQSILVDYVGLENFAYHLMDYQEEIQELYDALYEQFRQRVAIAAESPGTYVAILENFTAESLGPKRFDKYLAPAYKECIPVLHDAGKVVGCHYDGRTRSCSESIQESPLDLVESLTEPPEGDMRLEEAREVWPDKLFWVNIRVSDYQLPPDQLRDKVRSLVERGGVNGRQIAFEVSEDLPENWRESLPVVLDTLNELSL